jgi:hypothetical protein
MHTHTYWHTNNWKYFFSSCGSFLFNLKKKVNRVEVKMRCDCWSTYCFEGTKWSSTQALPSYTVTIQSRVQIGGLHYENRLAFSPFHRSSKKETCSKFACWSGRFTEYSQAVMSGGMMNLGEFRVNTRGVFSWKAKMLAFWLHFSGFKSSVIF